MPEPTALTRREFSTLLLPGVAGQLAAAPVTPAYEALLESNVRVAPRDGVHLATDVYRPALKGAAGLGRFHRGRSETEVARRGRRVLRARRLRGDFPGLPRLP